MTKTPKQRNEVEVQALKNAFKDIKYFDNLKSELNESGVMNVIKELTYETISKRSLVFNLGGVKML